MITRRAAAALVSSALVVGVAVVPPDPASAVLAPTVAVVIGAATWARAVPVRTAAWLAVLLTSAASLVVTLLALHVERFDASTGTATVLWMLLEAASLALCVCACVRWLSRSRAVIGAAVGVLASAVMIFRFDLPFSAWSAIGGCSVWALPSLSAVVAARFLRRQAAAVVTTLREAQQKQRLELAGDLHDFVAHDISEIVAQAQAGAIVFGRSDPELAQLLGRIEAAGLRSLASMDRTVDLLRGEARVPLGQLSDLPALTARFGALGLSDVDLHLDVAIEDVPRHVSALAYRVVVEALTNVRRHAGRAEQVSVDVRTAGTVLRVVVADDGEGMATRRRSSGSGLSGLRARVEATRGELRAGPVVPSGWRVEVELPMD